MKKTILLPILLFSSLVLADFKTGETVFVGFPASNIKDDAYIVGLVKGKDKNGDYIINVKDYIEGHNYGLSCVPMVSGEESGDIWDLWEDQTKLITNQNVDYKVPKENVRKYESGNLEFIERYNTYIVYGRWKSNAPIMSVDKLDVAASSAKEMGNRGLEMAFKMAIMDRKSYYEDGLGRPYWPHESLPFINKTLSFIIKIIDGDKDFKRYLETKDKSLEDRYYFARDALKEIYDKARFVLLEDDIKKPINKDVELYEKLIKELKEKASF